MSIPEGKSSLEVKHEEDQNQVDYVAPNDGGNVNPKRVLWKLDLRMIPWFSLLYLLSFLDRSNIGNAKLYNLERDLRMTDRQYLLCLTVFYFPYALFEIPSNILIKRIRPAWWISFIMFMWGVVIVCQGLVHDFGGLITARVFLGVFESGLFPGIAFYLSCYYSKAQFGLRVAIFNSAQSISGAFGGLLAAAISNMAGVGGKGAWAWIFILEGLATILAAIATPFIIDNYPQDAKFLTPEERSWLLQDLRDKGRNDIEKEPFHMRYVKQALSDYRVWFAAFIVVGFDGALYAFSVFTPSIIRELGFQATAANLLSVPVFVWAAIATCSAAYIGDKHKNIRGYINLFCSSVGMIGYIILLSSRKPALSYFAIYLAASGIYPTLPNTLAWVGGNVEGPLKRAVTLALCVGMGNLNGAVSSNIYRSSDAPWYPLGHGVVLAYIAVGFTASFLYRWGCKRANDKKDRGEIKDEVETKEFKTAEEAKIVKGDEWSGFRYGL